MMPGSVPIEHLALCVKCASDSIAPSLSLSRSELSRLHGAYKALDIDATGVMFICKRVLGNTVKQTQKLVVVRRAHRWMRGGKIIANFTTLVEKKEVTFLRYEVELKANLQKL